MAQLVICNVAGLVFYSGEVDLAAAINIRDLRLTYKLERGVYLVKIVATGLVDVKKIIIK